MKKILVNITFKDVYTGELYEAGKCYMMSEERVKEVKEVNKNFITVTGCVTSHMEGNEEEIVEEIVEEPEMKKKGRKK